jgi:tetratricopeptide (TPR) repeat protein
MLLETLRFNAAKEKGTAIALRQFIREHPDGAQRDEADGLLKKAELEEVASLDEAVALRRIASQNPEDARAASVAERLDAVAFARASDAASLLAYLRDFPAGQKRDEAKARLLSMEIDGLLVSGHLDEATAIARKNPLARTVPDLSARFLRAKQLTVLESRSDLARALPAWTRRKLSDVLASLKAPDALDRWQSATELGHFVSIDAIDPLLDQIRLARSVLTRQEALESLFSVFRALPRDVADYQAAVRIEATKANASDAQLFLTLAVLYDVSGQLERAAVEYQRAWDPQNPDPVVLRRWVAIRFERRQFFASATAARQLGIWALEEARRIEVVTSSPLGAARELCAANRAARFAVEALLQAQRASPEFPEDVESFLVRAKEAVRLTSAKLRDAELLMAAADTRARTCTNNDVSERLTAGIEERLKTVSALKAQSFKEWQLLSELIRWRDPSLEVRRAVAKLSGAIDTDR